MINLEHKKDSFFTFKGIPWRYICIVLAIIMYISYFVLGKLFARTDLTTSISGKINIYKINYDKKIGYLNLNIELENNDTLLVQTYYVDSPAKIFLGIDGNKLQNTLPPINSRIVSYYNKKHPEIIDNNSHKIALKTYGLKIDNTSIISVEDVSFLTFKVSIWGTASLLLLLASFLLFIIDYLVIPKK